MRKLLALALFGGLVASAAVAGPITHEQLASLKIGTTTYDEVVAQFGKPTTVETSSDGSREIAYTVIKSRVKAATFAPVVGLFAGGAQGKTQVDKLDFDANDVFTKVLTSETNVECKVIGGCGSKP